MDIKQLFRFASMATSFCVVFAMHLFAISAVNAADEEQPSVTIDVEEVKTISHDDEVYHGWPTVTRLQSGELFLVWSGGRDAHVGPFGRVDVMRSTDQGQTWSWSRTLLDSAIDDRDAGILQTSKGTLLVTSFTSLAYQPILERAKAAGANSDSSWPQERLSRWMAVHNRLSPELRKQELGQWMIRSTDGGLTWSRRFSSIVNSPHGPIQLSDGRLLYAGVRLWDKDREVGVSVSGDDGASWAWAASIPTRPGDRYQDYHELHAVQAQSGRIVVHIRNHNKQNNRELLQTESEDGGHSWSVPHSIGIWGLPSHLTRLSDGRLLVTYGYRRKPFGIRGSISADEGANWSQPFAITSDATNGDLGYPSTVQFEDGGLLTVWYEKMAGSAKACLRQARWKIDEAGR